MMIQLQGLGQESVEEKGEETLGRAMTPIVRLVVGMGTPAGTVANVPARQ
jgi:hypothetical protein